MACHAMATYKVKNTVETKFTCDCSEAPVSTVHQSLITGLGCALAASLVWAILATTRPTWLRNLKDKLINAIVKIQFRNCSPETGIDPNLPSASEPTPATQEPAASEPSPAAREPAAKVSLKIPRPRARVCPYRRTDTQLRRQIKEETYQDLRRLIKLAKLEAMVEVEAEIKAEAEAQISAETEAAITTILNEN